MLLCVGPEGSGKTVLLRRLLNLNKPDVSLKTVPTVGVNIVSYVEPEMPPIDIRELGGSMAPIWHNYYSGVRKVIYVIDACNLSQLGEATLLLMELLENRKLKGAQVAIVMNKNDNAMSRGAKELMNVMRLDDLRECVTQKLVTFEVSAMLGKGLRPLLKWVKGEQPKKKDP